MEVKYQLLNPSVYFQEIVNDARSVILAGGTMSPVSCHVHGSSHSHTQLNDADLKHHFPAVCGFVIGEIF